jgi:hypothetical protein
MKLRSLYPASFLAAGVLLASTLAVQQSSWLVLAAPVALALSVLTASALDAWLRDARARPSHGAMILATSFLLAGLLVAAKEPVQLKPLMPVLAASAAVSVIRPRRRNCLPQA